MSAPRITPPSPRAARDDAPTDAGRRWPREAARVVIGGVILVAGQLLGAAIARVLHLPIPGSVLGMLLLAAAVGGGVVPLRLVRPAADLLLRYLALLYVPAGVGIVVYTALLERAWLPVTTAALASLVVTLATAGLLLDRRLRAR